MASIEFSGIGITEMRGKSGTAVLSRNKGGNYSKAYVIPFNPNTIPQQEIRNVYRAAVLAWKAIDDDMREEWIQAAKPSIGKNRVSAGKSLTGYNYFIKVFFNSIVAGVFPPVVPPVKGLTDEIIFVKFDALSLTAFKVKIRLYLNSFIVPANCSVLIYGTNQLSAGIMSRNNGYTLITYLPAGSDLMSIDMFPDYFAVHGIPAPGSKIFLRARLYDGNLGTASVYVGRSHIVS